MDCESLKESGGVCVFRLDEEGDKKSGGEIEFKVVFKVVFEAVCGEPLLGDETRDKLGVGGKEKKADKLLRHKAR